MVLVNEGRGDGLQSKGQRVEALRATGLTRSSAVLATRWRHQTSLKILAKPGRTSTPATSFLWNGPWS